MRAVVRREFYCITFNIIFIIFLHTAKNNDDSLLLIEVVLSGTYKITSKELDLYYPVSLEHAGMKKTNSPENLSFHHASLGAPRSFETSVRHILLQWLPHATVAV